MSGCCENPGKPAQAEQGGPFLVEEEKQEGDKNELSGVHGGIVAGGVGVFPVH